MSPRGCCEVMRNSKSEHWTKVSPMPVQSRHLGKDVLDRLVLIGREKIPLRVAGHVRGSVGRVTERAALHALRQLEEAVCIELVERRCPGRQFSQREQGCENIRERAAEKLRISFVVPVVLG